MPRYIDAEKLKKMLRSWIEECVVGGVNETANTFRDCIDAIDSTPTADVAEARHAHVCENGNPICGPCSNCGESTNRSWSYCPNCGALMGGES